MKIKQNVDLSKYSKINIGGRANNFYIPENEMELIELIKEKKNEKKYIIANGSNILINDQKTFETVIYLKEFSKEMEFSENILSVGASVPLQKVLKIINSKGYGGIEYLYTVPGTLGGAIYMNAGTGHSEGKSISDYILEIKTFDGEKIHVYSKNEAKFRYRYSIFKTNKEIILSAKFKFPKLDKEIIDNVKNDKIAFARATQDMRHPNLGSIFDYPNVYIITFFKKIGFGWKKGIKYSKKSTNWFINLGEGTFKQAMFLIKTTEILHKIFFIKKIRREIEIWE